MADVDTDIHRVFKWFDLLKRSPLQDMGHVVWLQELTEHPDQSFRE